MSFGKRLKEARGNKKLTQAEVAEILGIDDTTISKYENDKSEPDNETLKKLIALYGISVGYVMGENTKQSSIEETENERDKNYILELIMKITDPDKKKAAIEVLKGLAERK